MLAVLRGSVGEHWLPQARANCAGLLHVAPFALVPWAAAIAVARRRPESRLRALVVLVVLAVGWATWLARGEVAAVHRAYITLWAVPLLAIASSAVGRHPKVVTVVGALLGATAVALWAALLPAEQQLSTDALECQWAIEWRRGLPPDALVLYAGQGSKYVLSLPLYGSGSAVGAEGWALTGGAPLPLVDPLAGRPVFYYESSMCATPDAGGICQALRARYRLERMEERTLPGRSGYAQLPDPVVVGLYRVTGSRS